MVFATVPVEDFRFVEGEEKVGTFPSSSFGRRQHCRDCGTPLTMRVVNQPETIDFTVSTLDDPEIVEPGIHIFHGDQIGWFETADALPRHERFRPDTRGLEGSDPPA